MNMAVDARWAEFLIISQTADLLGLSQHHSRLQSLRRMVPKGENICWAAVLWRNVPLVNARGQRSECVAWWETVERQWGLKFTLGTSLDTGLLSNFVVAKENEQCDIKPTSQPDILATDDVRASKRSILFKKILLLF